MTEHVCGLQGYDPISRASVRDVVHRPRVVFFIEYRHCKFPARRNQQEKWNKWIRYGVDWTRKRDAIESMKKCRVMAGFEELRVQRRVLNPGERMAR